MNDTMLLKFELESIDGKITKEFIVDDCEAWTNIILSYADFLSAQYGYGIAERILFISDFAIGRASEHSISRKEFEMIVRHREREQDLDSLFEDEQ